MAGKTLYDKLWEMHEVKRRDDGSSLIYIDRHILHEVTSPQAFEGLRLAGVLMEQKAYDAAMAQLSGSMPAEFAGVVADRKGDVLALLGKNQEAIAEYRRAYQAFGDSVEYRRLVEAKLNALGAQAQNVAVAAPAGSAQ